MNLETNKLVTMIAITLKRLFSGFTPIAIIFVLLLVSLYLMGEATQDSAQFSRMYSALLVINIAGIVVLVGLISGNIFRLIKHYRQGVAGSRLTLRLVVFFAILAMLPVSIVYYFSLGFLHQGIDSWFDVRIDQAMQDSLSLSRSALDDRMRKQLKLTELMSVEIADLPDMVSAIMLSDLRIKSGAYELTLMTNSRIIVVSSEDVTSIVPNRPSDSLLSYMRQGRSYVGLNPINNGGLFIRAVVRVPSIDSLAEALYLQSLFPVGDHQAQLVANVQEAYAKYNKLVYLRSQLKNSFTLILTLVLLLAVLTAVWAAFLSARKLAAPIRNLAEGTRAVAAGDYSKRLPEPAVNDEMGFLVQSFNDMTRKIAMARDDTRRSQREVEEQRTYLEALLAHLSSGVLSLDTHLVVRTANATATQILGVSMDSLIGSPMSSLGEQIPHLNRFVDALNPYFSDTQQEWRTEITIFGPNGRQILMCRGTALPAGGYVIVFDDITTLVEAQRNAAWGEVARRLAHEIKNPLTPIRLAAERLRHKYLGKMDVDSADVLDRSTHTIVQHVDHMKEMVNAFSEYAKAPQLQMKQMDLNNLVNEVLDLYRGGESGIVFKVELDAGMPGIKADDGRIRQVLHNLIKNSIESLDDANKNCISISTRCMEEATCRFVEIRIEDTGSGIPQDVLDRIFEPYVTTKTGGTGLGLAIVKRIIEEHGGILWASNRDTGGASFVIRLPVTDSERTALEPVTHVSTPTSLY